MRFEQNWKGDVNALILVSSVTSEQNMSKRRSVTSEGLDHGDDSASSPNGAPSPDSRAGGSACLHCPTCRRRLLGKCPARDLTELPSGPDPTVG